ncbi:MAG: AraC family transcriptional regulator [Planctomycetaceae bacterium]|nr:AraC family transcriptional regulator [Planctomycetaceae bacterium]
MAEKPPAFRSGGTVYHADACEPARKAHEENQITLKAFVRGQYPGTPLPESVLPGLRTIGYWNAARPQNWGLDWHRNEGIEIAFLQSGQEVFWTGASHWDIKAGDMTACGPWQLHRLGNPNIGQNTLLWFIVDSNIRRDNQTSKWPHWIILSKEDIDELIPLLLYNSCPVFHLQSKFVQTWEKLYRVLRDAPANDCPVSSLAILINEILYDVLTMLRKTPQKPEPFAKEMTPALKMVQVFLEELATIPRQLEYPWTLNEMAKLCRVSPVRFSQCCHQLTNLSPIHALNRLRIQLAEEMLQSDPDISVTKIAMACGFSTSQYFATVFRKWTGKTPSEYRQGLIQMPAQNVSDHPG